jgi:hypothetical protein
MRFRIIMTTAILGLVLSACGGNTHESIAEEQFDLMDEMLDILEDVTDSESAKEASGKMDKLGEKMADLAKRAKELPDPTPEQQKRLEDLAKDRQEEYSKRMQEVMSKMMQYPELRQAFSKASQSAGK